MYAVCPEPLKLDLTRMLIVQPTIFGGTVPLLMSCHLVLNLRDEYYLPRSGYTVNATQLGSIHSEGQGIHRLDSMGLPRISSWYSHQQEEG